MEETITLLDLLEYLVVEKNKSLEEAITFCEGLFLNSKTKMKQYEQGYLDSCEGKGARYPYEYYLAGYRSWR